VEVADGVTEPGVAQGQRREPLGQVVVDGDDAGGVSGRWPSNACTIMTTPLADPA
jgi:hypothetical protein